MARPARAAFRNHSTAGLSGSIAMAAPTRKYNPGFLTDDELVESFCVRTHEFNSMIEMLRECTGRANPHRIVIGPRGSGKTSLLLRVAVELRRDTDLSSRFFPIVFAEESYEVATVGEFWLEALSRLAAQTPGREDGDELRRSWEDLRTVLDDRALGERCLGALLDFADREAKRLVLLVENLNAMFADIADPEDVGWRLRRTLQTEPRILLLASATSRFDAIDNPGRALYDLFRVLTLRPLDANECTVLWESVSGRRRAPDTIRALQILTGGSPRLLAILARFGAGLSFSELMAGLLDLIDDHTEYFRSHVEALPAQERRVYLALADLWKPAPAREIADRARLDSSQCSAQLARLAGRGAVEVTGGSPRRKLYYLTERLYNIYYLMRRASGPAPLIESLVRFMASYYAPAELKDIGERIAGDAAGHQEVMRSLSRSTFAQLTALPAMEPHREELLRIAPLDFLEASLQLQGRSAGDFLSWVLIRAHWLAEQNRLEEALAICDEAIRRFGDRQGPIARVSGYRGNVLARLNRLDEALAAWDEVVRRFGTSKVPSFLFVVALAQFGKGIVLGLLNRLDEALVAWDEVVRHLEASEAAHELILVAKALVNKGTALLGFNRLDEALVAWDEVVRRFGQSDIPVLREQVEKALTKRAVVELRRQRYTEAIAAVSIALDQPGVESTETRWRSYLIRAMATLRSGNPAACEWDVVAILALLPEMNVLPREILDALIWLGHALGSERLRELIVASPSAGLLLPLTKALEGDLGIESRVAREVEEVAEDIRRDFAKMEKEPVLLGGLDSTGRAGS